VAHVSSVYLPTPRNITEGRRARKLLFKILNSYFDNISLEELGIQIAIAYSADGLLTEWREVY